MSKTSITTVVILVIIAAVGYYFYAPDSWKFWGKQTANVIDSLPDQTPAHERITAKHQFKDGTHIVAGEANSPTPCDILTVEAVVASTSPQQVTLKFTSKTDGDVCAQVITANRFKAEFQAQDGAIIKATWNNKPVELNLIPATSDEDLNDFETFIKG